MHLQLISADPLQAFLAYLLPCLLSCHLRQSHLPLTDLVRLIFQLSWVEHITHPILTDLKMAKIFVQFLSGNVVTKLQIHSDNIKGN